jgi:uncharacterized membrane protein YozB (DUF420 family)
MSPIKPTAERTFYLSMMAFIAAAFLYGFARTVFLRPLYPDVHAAREPFFYYVHGLVMFAWVGLFIAQVGLIGTRRVRMHRQLGLVAFVLVPVLSLLSLYAAVLGYHRPGGFTDTPLAAQLPNCGVIISIIFMFALYAGLALARRKHPQSHKRLMLLAMLILTEAPVTRWPIPFLVNGGLPASGRVTALFMLPLVLWDLRTQRRIHSATLWGVAGYVAYILTRDAVFGGGPFLSALKALVGAPG